MEPSRYVGRVGGLAVALGVGAAVFAGGGIAWAGPDSSGSPGSSAKDPSDPRAAGRKALRDLRGKAALTPRGVRSDLKSLAHSISDHQAASTPAPEVAAGNSKIASSKRSRTGVIDQVEKVDQVDKIAAKMPAAMAPRPALSDVVPQLDRLASALPSRSIVQSFLAAPAAVVTAVPEPLGAASPGHAVSSAVATVASRVLRPFAGNSPGAPPVNSPAELLPLAALRRGLSGAGVSLDQPSATAASPTLVLNGYNIVPTSVENVVMFYGLFTIPPGTPGVVQGSQEFEVVDPDSGDTVGAFDALVTNADSFFLGGTYRELYVTDATVADGADPDATPLPGTLISSITFDKKGRFGTLYTSTPSDTGNVVSLKLLTPIRDFRIPFPYDGGKVFTAVSIPVQLNDDYYIAPAPGSPERLMSIAGTPPFYTVAQGEQVFNVYQTGSDVPIGSFRGYVTTTSDALGAYTQAIVVAEYIDGPQGTGPGEVPPVGSVYNVIYPYNILYTGFPTASGQVNKTKISTPLGDIPIPFPFDATTIPDYGSLTVPGKYSFVADGDLQPIGINGLPPADVEIQGYQKYNVVDSDGHQKGSFDADVITNWTQLNIYSQAILVTNVTDGTVGTGPGDVPPVGSQFNFLYLGDTGFGAFYSAIPSDDGDILTFKIMTPFGDIPVPARYNAIEGLDDVEYYVPPPV